MSLTYILTGVLTLYTITIIASLRSDSLVRDLFTKILFVNIFYIIKLSLLLSTTVTTAKLVYTTNLSSNNIYKLCHI